MIEIPERFRRYAKSLQGIEEIWTDAREKYEHAFDHGAENGARIDSYKIARENGARVLIALNKVRRNVLDEYFDAMELGRDFPEDEELLRFVTYLGQRGREIRRVINDSDDKLRHEKSDEDMRKLNKEHPSYMTAWWMSLLFP